MCNIDANLVKVLGLCNIDANSQNESKLVSALSNDVGDILKGIGEPSMKRVKRDQDQELKTTVLSANSAINSLMGPGLSVSLKSNSGETRRLSTSSAGKQSASSSEETTQDALKSLLQLPSTPNKPSTAPGRLHQSSPLQQSQVFQQLVVPPPIRNQPLKIPTLAEHNSTSSSVAVSLVPAAQESLLPQNVGLRPPAPPTSNSARPMPLVPTVKQTVVVDRMASPPVLHLPETSQPSGLGQTKPAFLLAGNGARFSRPLPADLSLVQTSLPHTRPLVGRGTIQAQADPSQAVSEVIGPQNLNLLMAKQVGAIGSQDLRSASSQGQAVDSQKLQVQGSQNQMATVQVQNMSDQGQGNKRFTIILKNKAPQ